MFSSDETRKFIDTYKKFYFEDTKDNAISKEEFEDRGIPKDINRTNENLENYIINQKLYKGIYDAESFAWKAGKAKWEDGFGFKLPNTWVNGNGGKLKHHKDDEKELSKEDFDNFCSDIKIDIPKYDLKKSEDRKALFEEIITKYDLYNFGTVNIFNMMFFLSKGQIPIYDYFAHLAVKALYMRINPMDVFLGDAPGKNTHPRGRSENKNKYYMAINAMEEYLTLLQKVFPNEIYINDKYIPRELDQALWVYGHSSKNYFNKNK